MKDQTMSLEAYNRLRVIGKGSYGEVWLVKHRKDKKQYVLKKLDLHNASKRERKAAEQEAKLLSNLRHPNIVSYKDSFETEHGHLYIVMGFCEGGDLYTKLREQKGQSLSERQIVEWFVQIAMALQYLHERNILHRDLKTQNIFLTKSKIIKVGDLGIARVLEDSNSMAHTLIGTPYYMSPELFSNKPYNHKSDVWALGCCVYEMTTLRHAFNARDMNSLMYKILRGKMPQMPQCYSQHLVALIKSMLNQNPDRRPTVSRVLRDPYIKDNIALFLQDTKNKRPSTGSVGIRRSQGEGRAGRPPVKPTRAADHVQAASKLTEVSEISLEPLNIAPDLDPITEEENVSEAYKPTVKVEVKLAPAYPQVRMKPSAARVDSPVQTDLDTLVPKESINSRSPEASEQKSVLSRSPEGSVRSSAKSRSPEVSERVSRSPSDCSRKNLPALRRPGTGHRRNNSDPVKVVPSSSPTPVEVHRHLPVPRERDQEPRERDPRDKPRPKLKRKDKRRHSSEESEAPPIILSIVDKKAVDVTKSEPTRAGINGAAMKQVSQCALQPSNSSSTPVASVSKVKDAPTESGYVSASVTKEDITASQLSLARQRRREKKDSETPRSSRSIDLDKKRKSVQQMDYDVEDPDLKNLQEEPDGDTCIINEVVYTVEIKKQPECERKKRIPSVGDESESDHSSDSEGKVRQKAKTREEREINSFVSLLTHTLKLVSKDSPENSKDEDIVIPPGSHTSQSIPTTVWGSGMAENTGSVIHVMSEPVIVDVSEESVRLRMEGNSPYAYAQATGNISVPAGRTMTTTGRLWERITALRKDCIRGLGVKKLKEAYDILDDKTEEIEPRLLDLLGPADFELFAGKIWQLKFCEEAAFGLL